MASIGDRGQMCPRYRMTGEKYRHFQGKCIPIPGLSAIFSQDVTQLMVSGEESRYYGSSSLIKWKTGHNIHVLRKNTP